MPTKIFQNPHRENNVYYRRAWTLYSRSSGGSCAVFRDELMRYFESPSISIGGSARLLA